MTNSLPDWMFRGLMVSEGVVLTNDKDDKGGLTKFGISQRAYPSVDISALTIDKAKAIYSADYWLRLHLLPSEGLAYVVFDFGVNSGPARAAGLLQRIVGMPAGTARTVGPQTCQAVDTYIRKFGLVNLLNQYTAGRKAFLHEPGVYQAKYIKGWLARCDRVLKEGLAHV